MRWSLATSRDSMQDIIFLVRKRGFQKKNQGYGDYLMAFAAHDTPISDQAVQ
jgi:hypothetical protein